MDKQKVGNARQRNDKSQDKQMVAVTANIGSNANGFDAKPCGIVRNVKREGTGISGSCMGIKQQEGRFGERNLP